MNWILETRDSAYCFGVTETGMFVHTYWGKKLPYREDYPLAKTASEWASFNNPEQLTREEYPGYGDYKFNDPCLKATFADGTRDLVLRFKNAQEGPNRIDITLTDTFYPFEVKLTYQAHPDYNLIERSTTVFNHGETPVTIERIDSAQWHMPPGNQYRMTHLTGRWLDEWHLCRDDLTSGIKIIDSKRITTSHHHNPWFAIDKGNAAEDQGDVWFAVLAWSGNWRIAAEVTQFDSTRVNIGINDWDFALRLNPGESYTTPSTFGGYTANGFGGASHALHDFIREQVIPHKNILHKVLYNSWEATLFNVDVESQSKLADIAAKMGIELFVMDDGWFQGRNLDNAGLGDWWPDPAKFPNGLTPLIDHVNALGAGDGKSRQRSVPYPSGLGDPFPESRANTGAQSTDP
jgi:alpha-galactosidase